MAKAKEEDAELGDYVAHHEVDRRASQVLMIGGFVSLLVCLGVVFWSPGAQEFVQTSSSPSYPLNFLVVGDWGRNGDYNQTHVAYQMGRVAEELNVDFVISTGDNFYDQGLKGIMDPQFETSYSMIYTAPGLQKPWYTVLGNHDYRGNAPAQLSEALTIRDGRWRCQREFQLHLPLCGPSENGLCKHTLDIFFIDTSPYVDSYWSSNAEHQHNWTGLTEPRQKQLSQQTERLAINLRNSTATWKLVVGHHTIRSTGAHGNTDDVAKFVDPLLKAYDVDLYINGHDHSLQDIKSQDSKLRYITSGGGSKAWKNSRTPDAENGTQFYYDGQGFASVSVGPRSLRLAFEDAFGSGLHTFELAKPGLP
eukprot:TRINITY_DN1309_c0_g1_i1.p1 TRINITY_DN1309_c0_g1~~TRINITY_DN1309_c0_g1_i1.p1  ORF type:complete len:364 (-),score=31.30 TRINITY_DN1309_c0_g1_i1:77-1168(-)